MMAAAEGAWYAEHLRGRETGRGVTATVSRVLSRPRSWLRKHARARPAGGRIIGVRAEFRRQEPADAAHRQAARHRSRHLQSVLFADPAGHRGRGAARGLRGALRRHAARRAARRALRADAAAERSGRPDLPRPPAAEGPPATWSVRWRRRARRSSTAASSTRGCGIPSVHIDNAAAASEAMDHLYASAIAASAIVTGPLVSPLSRDRLRGATTRARGRRTRSAISS